MKNYTMTNIQGALTMKHKSNMTLGLLCIKVIALATLVTGCSDSLLRNPIDPNNNVFWTLEADHGALLMGTGADHNSIQLRPVVRDAKGNVIDIDTLERLNRVEWESSDSMAVVVSQSGLVTARKAVTRVDLYLTVSIGEVTRADTIWVSVNEEAQSQPIKIYEILAPPPGTSPYLPVSSFIQLSVKASDVNGININNMPVKFKVKNSLVAKFQTNNTSRIVGARPDDSTMVYAYSTAFGVALTDSIMVRTGWPLVSLFTVFEAFSRVEPDGKISFSGRTVERKGGPGSTFSWMNNTGYHPQNAYGFKDYTGVRMDVIFDDPDVALAFLPGFPGIFGEFGDAYKVPFDTTGTVLAVRQFVKPGEHMYTVLPFNIRGKIIISER